MSTQVYEIAQHYKLRECLGLGVGNGGYILTHCAAEHPRLFAGLVLISPSCQPAGWWEWGMGRVALTTLRNWGWAGSARDYFAKRLFSPATLQLLGGDSDLLRAFNRDIQTLTPEAVAGYLSAVVYRPSLVPFVKKLKCRVLLVYGGEGLYENDCMEMSNAIDKTRFALLEVQYAGVLVNEEKPTEMLSPLQLFLTALQLEGIGLGASLAVGS
jgi:pimeloyl-ACP methyl ester carboxylesterase